MVGVEEQGRVRSGGAGRLRRTDVVEGAARPELRWRSHRGGVEPSITTAAASRSSSPILNLDVYRSDEEEKRKDLEEEVQMLQKIRAAYWKSGIMLFKFMPRSNLEYASMHAYVISGRSPFFSFLQLKPWLPVLSTIEGAALIQRRGAAAASSIRCRVLWLHPRSQANIHRAGPSATSCARCLRGYTEKVAVPPRLLLPVPERVSLTDAASLPEVACTSS